MKKYNNLILFLLTIIISFSCQENSVEPISHTPIELNEVRSVLSNEELQQIAESIGSFINDADIKSEIISYATPITDNEVYRPFKAILPEGSARGRTNSVFATKLKSSLSTCNSCRTNSDLDSLLIILEESYAIYAPYLAEKFSNTEDPITISWWDGIDTTGVTPGILSSSISGRVMGNIISIDDDYASKNPTLVLMRYDPDNVIEEVCPVGDPCDDSSSGGSSGGTSYTPRDIDCRALADTDVLLLQIPEFRLHGNTRIWPKTNRIYLWSVHGEYTVNSNGLINASVDVNELLIDFQVSRYNGRKGNWVSSNTSLIRSNWRRREIEVRVVAAYKSGLKDFKTTGTIKVDADGDFTHDNSANYTITQHDSKQFFSVSFDRCSTLAFATSDLGYGLRKGYGVQRFNNFSFYFKTETR